MSYGSHKSYGGRSIFRWTRRHAPRLGRPPSFRGRGTMAPLLARRSKGNRGGVGSGSTELAEVLALPATIKTPRPETRAWAQAPAGEASLGITLTSNCY